MSDAMRDFAVLGAGSWGTALALQLARNGQTVWLWARSPQQIDDMTSSRSNDRFLPGVVLDELVTPVADLALAVGHARRVLVAVPSHAFAGLLERIAPRLTPEQGLAWACKGFEPGSGRLLHQVALERFSESMPMAVVTGPSFAREVAEGLPTAVTVAGQPASFTEDIARRLHGGHFRAYTSNDMVGAELGGAVKNVLAVATGICDGMALGDNARAALITRGLAEMMRLGNALEAQSETLIGLAGLGDLVLTCTGDQSRNRRLGLALGRGESVSDAVRDIGQVVEGVGTSAEVWRLAQALDVSMPISREVFYMIHEGHEPRASLQRLLSREQKSEY